jgi:CubicO group peptidase (beta-lactamase class C family)
MPIVLPKQRKMPQSVKRHIVLRDLAHMQAGDAGEKLSRSKADARARELAKDTLPHTADFWKTKIEPGYE